MQKNQQICRFHSRAIWQSVHFWAIFDPKCPKKNPISNFLQKSGSGVVKTGRLSQRDIHTDIHTSGQEITEILPSDIMSGSFWFLTDIFDDYGTDWFGSVNRTFLFGGSKESGHFGLFSTFLAKLWISALCTVGRHYYELSWSLHDFSTGDSQKCDFSIGWRFHGMVVFIVAVISAYLSFPL